MTLLITDLLRFVWWLFAKFLYLHLLYVLDNTII